MKFQKKINNIVYSNQLKIILLKSSKSSLKERTKTGKNYLGVNQWLKTAEAIVWSTNIKRKENVH